MDFDPEAYVSQDTQSAPDLPVITDSLRPTTYGPGSPNPTPADMRENVGTANNPLQAGDVALQPETASKYGLKTGDRFVYQGQVYRYADTPNERVGNVIDIYHPSGEFDPRTYVNPPAIPTETPFPTGVETGTSPKREFDPQSYLEPPPAEPAPKEEEQKSEGIRIPSFEPTSIPQVSTNIPNVPTSPMPIIGARQPSPPAAPIPQPAPTPGVPPAPSTLDKPLVSEDLARIGLRSAVGALKTMYPVAGQQVEQFTQAFPQVAQGIEDSATNTLQGLTVPTTIAVLPLLSVPFVAEAWGAAQLAKTPQALSGVADVVKRYGLNSRESASAITGEVTRLAMAGTALHRPLMSMAREVVGTPAFAGKVNESGGVSLPEPFPRTGPLSEIEKVTLVRLRRAGNSLTKSGRRKLDALEAREKSSFGSAGITRAGESGSVPLPSRKRVLPAGAVEGSGRYKPVYQLNKEAGDKMSALAAAPESASLRSATQAMNVIGDLNQQEVADLGKYLVSERLLTVNPDHPQILDHAEVRRIAQDPRIAKAIERYARDVKPEIEALRKRAGLPEQAASGKSRTFISLIPKTDEMLPNAPAASSRSLRYKSKTTTFAKKAEGFAKEYETDLPTILERSYGEVIRKARFRDLYESLVKNDLTSVKPVKEIKGQPAVPIDIGRAAGTEAAKGLPDTSYMPAQIADAIKDIMEKPPRITSPVLESLKTLQRGVTGAALTANPLELLNHMHRQLDVVAAMPASNATLGVRALEAMTPFLGPRLGVAIRTFTEDMSSPVNQKILQDIFDAGGGSTRAFKEFQAKGVIAKKTGLTALQNATQKLLFGIPSGKGVSGWDLRMRVQLEKIRRAVEPELENDPQRIREFANQIGEYTSKPSKLVETVKNVNPYAATTLPMRGTELKQLLGGSGLKSKSGAAAAALRAETLLRGTGGTLIALATANRLLSGHWPWENDKGKEFHLATGMYGVDGKMIYWNPRWFAPTLSRPVNTLSLPQLSREGTASNPNYLGAATTGPANQLLSIISSPLSNAAWTGLTGTAPYLVKRPGQAVPSLLNVAKGPTNDRGVNQLLAAIEGINPAGQYADQLLRSIDVTASPNSNYVAPRNVVPARIVKSNVVKGNVVRARVRR